MLDGRTSARRRAGFSSEVRHFAVEVQVVDQVTDPQRMFVEAARGLGGSRWVGQKRCRIATRSADAVGVVDGGNASKTARLPSFVFRFVYDAYSSVRLDNR